MILSPSKKGTTPNTRELIGLLPKLRSGISRKDEGPDTTSQWSKNWKLNKSELIAVLSNPDEIKKVANRKLNIEIKRRKQRNQHDLSPQERKKTKTS